MGEFVVWFARDLTTPFAPFTYTAPANTHFHLITGLTPGAQFDAVVDGSTVTLTPGTQLIADAGGVVVVTLP